MVLVILRLIEFILRSKWRNGETARYVYTVMTNMRPTYGAYTVSFNSS